MMDEKYKCDEDLKVVNGIIYEEEIR